MAGRGSYHVNSYQCPDLGTLRNVFGFLLAPVLASGYEPATSNIFQLLTEDATPKLPPPGLQKRYFKRYLYKCYQLYYYESFNLSFQLSFLTAKNWDWDIWLKFDRHSKLSE